MADFKKIIAKIPFISFKTRKKQDTESYNAVNIGSPRGTPENRKVYEERLLDYDKELGLLTAELKPPDVKTKFSSLESIRDFNIFADIGDNIDLFAYTEDIRKIDAELLKTHEIISDPLNEGDIDGVTQIRWRKVVGCVNGELCYFMVLMSNPYKVPEAEEE